MEEAGKRILISKVACSQQKGFGFVSIKSDVKCEKHLEKRVSAAVVIHELGADRLEASLSVQF
jgi:hypothetical protein